MSDQENKSELKEEIGSCCCSVPLPPFTGCPPPVRQVGNYKAVFSRITYYKDKERKQPAKKVYSYSKRKTKK